MTKRYRIIFQPLKENVYVKEKHGKTSIEKEVYHGEDV